MIEIDGSFGEGGGQVLRSSLALSLLTGKPFRLRKIRANRKPKPGLRPQHLASVRAAARIGSAKVSGDAVGSSNLIFEPGQVCAGKYHFPIGTAGATALVLHTVYLPLALADGPSEIVLEGGTHNDKAPCFHFLDTTWRAYMARLGMTLPLEMKRPGFYPRGGGLVIAHVQPWTIRKPLRLFGPVMPNVANILSATAGLPDHVSNRQARRATVRLRDAGVEPTVTSEEWPGDPGCVLAVTWAATVPTLFFGLGARGKPAEAVADEAIEQALAHRDSGMPVDPHSADQLLLPLAIADGDSEFHVSEVTRHLTTNAAVIQFFLERNIAIEGEEGSPGVVKVAGRAL
ncbi:MAG TPA: RNA 3'-terminal phosphate cyclase [Gemmataceae bacterium]|jgi:RNA 3'-terminal phosphate cyclase (ATP)|nr:RNA 3'-terminal phosphate cyclase [Gemmataceae bacterium]